MTTNENKRSWLGWVVGGALLLLIAGLIVWRGFFMHGANEENATGEKETATAQVQVAALAHGSIERTLTAYGTAIAAPGGTRSLSFPFECRVVAVPANVGQAVAAGDTLLQIEPSADARLTLESARGARDAADRTLKDTQERLKARLATNQDLAAADAAARDARLKFESLQGRGPGADGIVRAPEAGIVTRIAAQPGAVVPTGGPLVEIAVESRFEARLGIAPPDALEVQPGQNVHLFPVQPPIGQANGGVVAGTVRVVGRSIDPATRMVDAFVTLDQSKEAPFSKGTGQLLIGTYLRAEIVVEKKEALLAPRAAVLPLTEAGNDPKTDSAKVGEDEAGVLFVVEKDRAVKHEVKVGINDGRNVEITAGGDKLKEGQNVVTQGNSELEDGMAVEIEKPRALDKEEKPDAPEKPGPADTPAALEKAAAKDSKDPEEKPAP